jgi:hypothetical protein
MSSQMPSNLRSKKSMSEKQIKFKIKINYPPNATLEEKQEIFKQAQKEIETKLRNKINDGTLESFSICPINKKTVSG